MQQELIWRYKGMNFWKKLTACALAAVMSAGFAGCGNSGGDSSEKEESDEEAAMPYDSDFTIGVDKVAEAMGAGWNVGNQLEANSGGKVVVRHISSEHLLSSVPVPTDDS